ncbi:DUF481 domain-containing protein [Phaeocystidibacter marisrubri]|uniref:DUF481 domain-containing protein n=1 Tax=Phaeocystidibacter marisrubri TaxID=1577780 RepID=A0A6L3ZI33_9FLAO|nr:DUF481 domain-containing protein [Phaeocystidibacter marisrubri]KAB2817524.1 DUF481 domain-containing protein [Phaeocystidibacter marisrubri]
MKRSLLLLLFALTSGVIFAQPDSLSTMNDSTLAELQAVQAENAAEAARKEPVFDTLWLRNGLYLYGEFTSIDVGLINFDAEVIGDVTLKHYEVSTFRASSNIYRMKTLYAGEFLGWVLPGEPGTVRIYDLNDTVVVPFTELVYLVSFENSFLKRWSGLFSAGYSYTRSSNISRYNMSGSVNYAGEHLDMALSGSMIVTGEGDSLTREREELHFTSNFYFANRWSIFGVLSYQRNVTLGLRYRYQEGPGVTYTRYLTNQMRIAGGVGAVINQEESFAGARLNSIEVPALIRFHFFRYRNPKISLTTSQSVYFGVTEVGRFRHDGEIQLAWEIVDDLSLTLTLYDSYDTQSPSTGGALLDYGTVTGLSYSF